MFYIKAPQQPQADVKVDLKQAETIKCDDCGNVWVVPLRIKRDFGDREVLTPTQLTYSRKHSKEKRK